jgi:hypothetical protein
MSEFDSHSRRGKAAKKKGKEKESPLEFAPAFSVAPNAPAQSSQDFYSLPPSVRRSTPPRFGAWGEAISPRAVSPEPTPPRAWPKTPRTEKSLSLNGEEVDEEYLGSDKDLSPTFSTFSLPSPPDHPRAWSPPPLRRADEQQESTPDQPGDSNRLGNYAKRRRELLDILNDLHSTGYVQHLLPPLITTLSDA